MRVTSVPSVQPVELQGTAAFPEKSRARSGPRFVSSAKIWRRRVALAATQSRSF